MAFNICPPIFRSNPPLVVGTPVFWAKLLFIPVIPSNLFIEKETPNFLLNPNISSIDFKYLTKKAHQFIVTFDTERIK